MTRTTIGSRRVRVDLHVHTDASFDCAVDAFAIAQRCTDLGLTPIFVTDHDSIAAARRLQDQSKADVVVGQEVSTLDGHLIGLFLDSQVQPGLPCDAAARSIKEQGGLVCLPHPFDPHRPSLPPDAIDRIVNDIDIIEVVNARAPGKANQSAEELSTSLGSVRGAGSDAHSAAELGAVYVEMEEFNGASDFLRKLDRGRIVTGPSRLRLNLEAQVRRLSGTSLAILGHR